MNARCKGQIMVLKGNRPRSLLWAERSPSLPTQPVAPVCHFALLYLIVDIS